MVSNVNVTGNSLRECYTSDWGKRLSRSGCQARVVHHLLVHVSANPARVRSKSLVSVSSCKICHILPFPLDSNGVVVRIVSFGLALSDPCSLMMTLSLMVVVNSWVTSSTIFACCSCRSALAVAAVLNSWNSVSCLEKSRCSRPSSWRSALGPYFSDTDFASAFDSSILRNCGCPFHASLQLALRAHALQRSAFLMLLFQRLLHSSSLVL